MREKRYSEDMNEHMNTIQKALQEIWSYPGSNRKVKGL